MKPKPFTLLGVACISLAILLLEITLTRVFSVTMWYHFAFMAISLALLGGAVGSVVLFALRARIARRPPAALLAGLAAVFGLSVPLAFGLYLRIPFQPAFVQTAGGLINLALIYLVAAVPFFWGGLCLALALSTWAREAGVVYFADLTGASLGCVVAIVALDQLGGASALLMAGAVAGAASVAFSLAAGRRSWTAALAVLTIALGALALAGPSRGVFTVTSGKAWMGWYEANVDWERWNSFSRVTIGSHDVLGLPFGWGLSDQWPADRPNPGQRLITIDAGAGTPIQRWDHNPASVEFLKYDVTAFVHYLRQDARMLIIGLGGGRDALTALLFNQTDITGVEINPLIFDAVKLPEPDGFADFAGYLFDEPRIHVHVGDGRNFVARSEDRYDIIQAALADTWAASSAGAFALAENSLYTEEAFGDYYRHLSDGGILTFSRWYVVATPGEMLRLVNLGLSAWGAEGVAEPERHLVVVANRMSSWTGRERLATLLLKRTPFTAEELARVDAVAAQLNFEVLYSPAPGAELDNPVARFVSAPDRAAAVAAYPVDIRPPDDDRPFFFYLFQPLSVLQPGVAANTEIYQLSFQGVRILLALLAIVSVLVVLLIGLPLRALRRGVAQNPARRPGVIAGPLAYFSCLGLGFILVEVPTIQRLVLFLGQPTYALAVVLLALLLFSGLGSLLSSRLPLERGRAALVRVLAVLVALVLLLTFTGPWLLERLLPLALRWRVVASIILIAPLGLLMGIPFPLRLRSLGTSDPELVPWVWGVNGALSVLGSVLSVFIAINAGFRVALLAGALCYGVALVLALRWRPAEEAEPRRPVKRALAPRV